MIDPEHRRLRARVDQPDLPQTGVGQRLIVAFDGLPGLNWDGRVTFVDPGLREVGGREVGEVLGEIADPQASLPSNAAVDVEIITGEKSGALVVPRASVFRDGDRRYVYVLDGPRAPQGRHGRAARPDRGRSRGRPRRKGLVILPGAITLSDGARVRATSEKG